MTLWLWPTGLFPRRVIYYFRAKQLTLSKLSAHNITLVPVVQDKSQTGASSLITKSGYEARPPNTSLPCLRVEKPDTSPVYIHESVAILEYFEELFGKEEGYTDLRGKTPEQRAKTRDVLSLLNDAVFWGGLQLMHSHEYTLTWSGMKREQQSASSATDAKMRKDYYLSRLEGWVQEDIINKEDLSLSGQGTGGSLADFVLMAMIDYNDEIYGRDFVEEHGVLRVWWERARGAGWYVDKKGLKRLEESNLEEL